MSILGCFYIFFVIILCLNCLSYIFVVISASSVSFNISLESFCLLCAVIYYCLFHFQLFYVSEILLKPHLSDLTSLCGFFMSASGSFMFFSSCLSSVFLWFDVFFVILNLTEIIFFSYVISYLILVVLCLCLFSFPVVFMCLCSIFSFMSCQSFFASLCLSFCSFIFVVFCFFLVVLSFSLQFLKKL